MAEEEGCIRNKEKFWVMFFFIRGGVRGGRNCQGEESIIGEKEREGWGAGIGYKGRINVLKSQKFG